LQKCETSLAQENKSKAECDKDLQNAIEKATEVCPRDNTEIGNDETPEYLKRKIKQLETQLEESLRGRRSLQDVKQLFKTQKDKYMKLSKQIANSQKIVQRVENSLIRRKETWDYFLRVISKKTKCAFNVYLSQKGFSGDLKFDHEKQTLYVSVNLDSNQDQSDATRHLSGGERSFSTVSLLLALWETMELPFCAMDEFDVFMDAINRHVSIEMLVKTGERHRHRQFIFISPHNPSAITAGPHVRIHRMSPPERGQRTLDARSQTRADD